MPKLIKELKSEFKKGDRLTAHWCNAVTEAMLEIKAELDHLQNVVAKLEAQEKQ